MVTVTPIRLLMIDDHPVLRAGLANLLEQQPDFKIVGQAGTGEEALRIVTACKPDVCLLDLRLPGMNGFETLRQLSRLAAKARVLVFTSSDSADDAERALAEGAAGFISKTIDHGEIVSAIRDVHHGQAGISKGVAMRVPDASSGILTDRELEVLTLLRKGLSNPQIGRLLCITERTVKGHVTAILKKMDATDRAGAVARGFELGLLKLHSPGVT
jgi:DNA-binding NarL/FixJ family response regulator